MENYLSVLTGASDNFLISFPSRFYSLKWKACHGWCNFRNWREALIYILLLSVSTISPTLFPVLGLSLAEGFLGTSPPLHCFIFFNEGKDFSSAPWHSQTLLQQVWNLWWFCIWFFVCCLVFKKALDNTLLEYSQQSTSSKAYCYCPIFSSSDALEFFFSQHLFLPVEYSMKLQLQKSLTPTASSNKATGSHKWD